MSEKSNNENGSSKWTLSRLPGLNLINIPKEDRARLIKVGIFFAVTILSVTIIVSILSRTRSLFAEKVHLHVYFQKINGLIIGAPVRLQQFQVGIVDRIQFVDVDVTEVCPVPKGQMPPPSHGKKTMLRLELNIQKEHVKRIPIDSVVILDTKGLLGDPIVDITAGTADKQANNGDCLQSVRIPSLNESINELKAEAKTTLAHADKVLTHVDERIQTVLSDDVVRDLQHAVKGLASVVHQVEHGPGLVHDVVYDPRLRKQVDGLLTEGQGAAHQLRGALVQARSTLRGADALVAQATQAATSINQLLGTGGSTKTGAPQGGHEASGLVQEVRGLMSTVKQVAENLKVLTDQARDPNSTVGKFFQDPTLYDNANAVLESATAFFNELKSHEIFEWFARRFVKAQQQKQLKAQEPK